MSVVMRRGLTLFSAQAGLVRLIQTVVQLIIASIISPDLLGVVAIALAFAGISLALQNGGIDDFLIQRAHLYRRWKRPAAFLALAAGILVAIIVGALSLVLPTLYDAPELRAMFIIVAATNVVGGLNVVPIAKMRADLRFERLAVIGFCEVLVVQGLTLMLVLEGQGGHAFVLPLLMAAALKLIYFGLVNELVNPFQWMPRPTKFIISKSRYIVGHRSLTSVIGHADTAILGLFAQDRQVGLYAMAFRIASQPMTLLASSVSHVVFPMLASIARDKEGHRLLSKKTLALVSAVVASAAAAQIVALPKLFDLILGTQWKEAIVYSQLLTLALTLDASNWISSSMLFSQGDFRRQFRLTLSFSIYFVALVLAGAAAGGAAGVVASVAIYYATVSPVLLSKTELGRVQTYGKSILTSLAPTAVAGLTALAIILVTRMSGLSSSVGAVAAGSLLACLSTFAVLVLFNDQLRPFVLPATKYLTDWWRTS